MSLIPSMLFPHNLVDELHRPHRLLDQHFGLGIDPDQLMMSPRRFDPLWNENHRNWMTPWMTPSYYRPWADLLREADGGVSTISSDKDQFEVKLDIQQFKPDEINVKVANNCVIVDGKHEEKRDEHGWISRQFTRKYMIPEQCDIDHVSSNLSSDGVLTITAPKKNEPGSKSERPIKIQHTGKPALKAAKEPEKKVAEDKAKH